MIQILYKIIYQPQINFLLRNLNKALYPILPKAVKIPPSGKISMKIEDQPLTLVTNQTNYLTQLTFWNGYLNFEYTPIFLSLVKKVDSFFDVGANIGYYSLLAATTDSKMNITAFEPAFGPLHYLKENVKTNNFKNIRVEDIALSDKNGRIEFYEVQSEKYTYLKYNLAGEGNTGSKTTERNYVKNEVATVPLDEYVNNNDIRSLYLMKIDTEGTEHLILEKAKKVLSEFQPIIICETLFGMIENELDEILSAHGYEFFNHVGDRLVPVKTIRRAVDNGVTNCFFVHPTKRHLIEEYL